MATEHEFPEWVDVQDRPKRGFWHDGTPESKHRLVTLAACTVGMAPVFAWTLSNYGPLLGWW